MSPELDAALVRDFPNWFQQRSLSMRESCMGRGFECGDGWEMLIRELATVMEPLAIRYGIQCSQVKEKFGLLRIYFDYDYENPPPNEVLERVWERLADNESRSASVCERCGSTNDVTTEARQGYWIVTECATCRATTH